LANNFADYKIQPKFHAKDQKREDVREKLKADRKDDNAARARKYAEAIRR